MSRGRGGGICRRGGLAARWWRGRGRSIAPRSRRCRDRSRDLQLLAGVFVWLHAAGGAGHEVARARAAAAHEHAIGVVGVVLHQRTVLSHDGPHVALVVCEEAIMLAGRHIHIAHIGQHANQRLICRKFILHGTAKVVKIVEINNP